MSFGTSRPWRLLSLFTALLWAFASVGFAAGAAQADASHGRTANAAATPDQHANLQAGTHADAHAAVQPDTPTTTARDHQTSGTAGTSGDVTSPQPVSHADANSGGANGQCPGGPYCSTRDGSPSLNGNGGGAAVGKPCAGCVGKADNKNPQGQMPNGSDHNAGYECDTNHGIGKSNPAHTGCQTGSQPGCVPTETVPCVPPECVPTETVPCVPPECVPTETVPCAPTPPTVEAPKAPTVVSTPRARPVPVLSPTVLPNTGAPADLVWLTGTALASVLAGLGLLAYRRNHLRPHVS